VIEPKWQRCPKPDDLLLVWNRTRAFDPIAEIYERRVPACWSPRTATSPGRRREILRARAGRHNGAGRWFVGDEPRFEIAEQPWRTSGSRCWSCPSAESASAASPCRPTGRPRRSIGSPDHRSRARPAPSPRPSASTRAARFRDIWCAVTWGSGAAIKALQAGIPVFYDFDRWIGGLAAARLVRDLESCQTPDRRTLWTRISWAQWTLDEIASGEALDRLLHEEDRGLFRAGNHRSSADRQRRWSRGSPPRGRAERSAARYMHRGEFDVAIFYGLAGGCADAEPTTGERGGARSTSISAIGAGAS
jgi:hypothetical protein